MTPSQRRRTRKPRPRRAPQGNYSTASYRRAIQRACAKAGIPRWHPNQLRHTAATKLRARYGIEIARVVLGHSSAVTSELYAEIDHRKVQKVMAEIG